MGERGGRVATSRLACQEPKLKGPRSGRRVARPKTFSVYIFIAVP